MMHDDMDMEDFEDEEEIVLPEEELPMNKSLIKV